MKRKAHVTKRERKVEKALNTLEAQYATLPSDEYKRRVYQERAHRLNETLWNNLELAMGTAVGNKVYLDIETGGKIHAVMSPENRARVAAARTSIFTKLFPK